MLNGLSKEKYAEIMKQLIEYRSSWNESLAFLKGILLGMRED